MAETLVLDVQERKTSGSHIARRLRKLGQTPAVVYGHKEATVSLTIPTEGISKAIRQGVRIIDLKHDGKVEKALIRAVQWDSFGQDILHVDFTRVAADEKIHIDVRVELRGVAPGVTAGGVLVQPIHSLHVECLVISIPESIRVSVAELQLNQIIHVSDLKLPEGVVVKNEPDAIVVQCSPKVEETETAGEVAEPEVIGKKAEKEEGEE
jgi:large subunit ribosomal protein L25